MNPFYSHPLRYLGPGREGKELPMSANDMVNSYDRPMANEGPMLRNETERLTNVTVSLTIEYTSFLKCPYNTRHGTVQCQEETECLMKDRSAHELNGGLMSYFLHENAATDSITAIRSFISMRMYIIYSAVIGSPYEVKVGQLLRSKDLLIRILWPEQFDIVASISYGPRTTNHGPTDTEFGKFGDVPINTRSPPNLKLLAGYGLELTNMCLVQIDSCSCFGMKHLLNFIPLVPPGCVLEEERSSCLFRVTYEVGKTFSETTLNVVLL
uniref:Uncharacterized protein n=1 Tax=Timema bartmani TaxID=61472 RepID=A0A7R9F1V1_9NEOP|nr:unnamed protein product [Timema bartmani]